MILITGATCPTGEEVLRLLVAKAPDTIIRCISRGEGRLGIGSVEWLTGDLKDPEFVSRAMNGVDQVLHVAGIHTSTMLAQEAARRKGIRRVIYVHTTSRFANHKAAARVYAETESEVHVMRRAIYYSSAFDGLWRSP